MLSEHKTRRGRRGFTLVELLVVMAIITILASISIPVVVNYIRQGQSTRALADINGIETALTEVLADAGRSSLEQLFDADGVKDAMLTNGLQNWPPLLDTEFKQAVQLYTRALTGILRSGRNVLSSTDSSNGLSFNYADILQPDIVRKLGTSYIDLGPDPWGNLYNIYPGPWAARYLAPDQTTKRTPIPFRIFDKTDENLNMPGASSSTRDKMLAQFEDVEAAVSFDAGYPAPSNEIAFIWSNGQNLLSSQLLYDGAGYQDIPDAGNPQAVTSTWYDGAQADFCCGGDDINNWDNGNSWTRFY